MNCGCDCGSIMVRPAAAPVSPLQIVAADDIIAGWDAAVRVTVGTAVFTLPDVSGNGFNLDQAVALNQPAVVVGGGPNGNDSILFDGVNDFMTNGALDLPMASPATPTTYWAVLRQITWTASDVFWAAGVNGIQIAQSGVGIDIVQADVIPANGNSAFTLNIYMLLESMFNDSTTDYLLVGGNTETGTSAGGLEPPAGFFVGGNAGPTQFSNIELCELWLFRTVLTIQQRSQLRAYATNRYGAIP